MDEAGGKRAGAVNAFARDAQTGRLTWINRQSSGGTGPCHLAVDATGQCLLVANYGSGTIAALPVRDDGGLGEAATLLVRSGSGPNPKR